MTDPDSLEPLCRTARLVGFLRGCRIAIEVLDKHRDPSLAYQELLELVRTSDEDTVERMKAQ
jgi:hypothetical protein